ISKTCWDFTQTHSLRISRYSDSLEGRGLRFALPLHSQRLPYRLVARPQSTRRSFPDYGHWRPRAPFFLGKLPTAQERNACRREEAGRDLITVVAFPVCRFHFRQSDAASPTERRIAGDDRLRSGQGLQAFDQLPLELPGSRLVITAPLQVGLHRERPLRFEARVKRQRPQKPAH